MDVAAEGRKEQIRQRDTDEKDSVKRARTEYAQRARIGAIVTVDEPEPVIDVEPTDASSCLHSVSEGTRKGRQEAFANMNGVGVFKIACITADNGLMFGELVCGAVDGSAERTEHGIHNETMFTRQDPGDKTARIIEFMPTMRQLKCVVGDAANASCHAEGKGKPCCKQLGDILNASTAEGKPIDVVIVM